MKTTIQILLFTILSFSISASATETLTLHHGWHIIRGFDAFAKGEPVDLPHTWNAADGMYGNTDYYRGLSTYRKALHVPVEWEGKRIFLKVDAAQTIADVFVDNQFVMQHRGGYTAFVAELTDFLQPGKDAKLDILVNNTANVDIAPICGDFNIFGGLYRGVQLLITEDLCIDPTYYASSGVFFTQTEVSEQQAKLRVTTLLSHPEKKYEDFELEFQLWEGNKQIRKLTSSVLDIAPDLFQTSHLSEAQVTMNMEIKKPRLWNGTQDPFLYKGIVILRQNGMEIDRREEEIGFRYFHADPEKGFFLNGRPYRLLGANYHQDRAERASALHPKDYMEDFDLMQEMGSNAVRFCHYPHAKFAYQQADRRGLVSWPEIPFVNVFVNNPAYKENLRQQLHELILQNYNHPSILFWGLFNEINSGWMERPFLMVKELHQLARQLDPTRPTMGASNQNDDFNGFTDLIAFNKYFGWYGNDFHEMGEWIDQEHANHPGRMMGVSEYGAGGSVYQQIDTLVHPDPWGAWHPENWQTLYHIENWKQLQQREFLWCNFIWCMFDFSVASRKEGSVFGRNDKGMVTYDRQVKKDSFYFYKANWNKNENVLYIADRRNDQRRQPETTIQVFSNCGEAELFVNGVSFGKRAPDAVHVLTWDHIPIQKGENRIEVKNKTMKDECTWWR